MVVLRKQLKMSFYGLNALFEVFCGRAWVAQDECHSAKYSGMLFTEKVRMFPLKTVTFSRCLWIYRAALRNWWVFLIWRLLKYQLLATQKFWFFQFCRFIQSTLRHRIHYDLVARIEARLTHTKTLSNRILVGKNVILNETMCSSTKLSTIQWLTPAKVIETVFRILWAWDKTIKVG